jgi:hypothetical protein
MVVHQTPFFLQALWELRHLQIVVVVAVVGAHSFHTLTLAAEAVLAS